MVHERKNRRVGHWWKNPDGKFFDESHTLITYWDEEKYCFRCGSCNAKIEEGSVCKCSKSS
jgi:hypothetical protein